MAHDNQGKQEKAREAQVPLMHQGQAVYINAVNSGWGKTEDLN